jgi:hypothetical protein
MPTALSWVPSIVGASSQMPRKYRDFARQDALGRVKLTHFALILPLFDHLF